MNSSAELESLKRKLEATTEQLESMASAQSSLFLFQEKIERQKTIYAQIADVGHHFNQSFNLNEVFEAVSRFCIDLLNFEKFALLLPSEGGLVEVKASGGYHPILGEKLVDGLKIETPKILKDGRAKWLVRLADTQPSAAALRKVFQVDDFCIYSMGLGESGPNGLLFVGGNKAKEAWHRTVDEETELDALFSNVTSLVAGAQTTVKFMAAIQHESAQVHRLLNNMKQAVFSIDSSALVGEPVSRFSEEIFQQSLVGTNVYESVFKDLPATSEARSRMQTALTVCFGENDMQWMMMADDFPQKFHFHQKAEGPDAVRTLKLNVQPIWDDQELLEKLMFVIEDVTEIEKLELQIGRERLEIEMIQQILRNDLSNVRDFFSKAAQFMSTSLEILAQSAVEAEAFGILMRTLHTLKGNSRLLTFVHISNAVHHAESEILELKAALSAGPVFATSLHLKALETLLPITAAIHTQAKVARRLFKLDTVFRDFIIKFQKVVLDTKFQSGTLEQQAHLALKLCALTALPTEQSWFENCTRTWTHGGASSQDFLSALEKMRQNSGGSETAAAPGGLLIIEVVDQNLKQLRSSIEAVLRKPACPQHLAQLTLASQRLTDVPLTPFLQKIEGLVNEVAGVLNKKVQFEVSGEASVPRERLSSLQDITVQLVRNALDHGLELAPERVQAGKAETGKLQITCREDADGLDILFKDDGRGIDPTHLANLAVKKGLIEQAVANKLSMQQKIELIFLPGFSSKEVASDLSGRGVGMDIVKATCESLHGTIVLKSTAGKGTEFHLRLPLT